MNKNRVRKLPILIAAILIVVIVCSVLFIKYDNNGAKNDLQNNKLNTTPNYPVDVQGNINVKTNADGSKENISSTVKQDKTVDGYKFSNINIVFANGISTVTADIHNNTSQDVDTLNVTIQIKDKDGSIVRELPVVVNGLKADSTKTITASVTSDMSNAYDLTFSI